MSAPEWSSCSRCDGDLYKGHHPAGRPCKVTNPLFIGKLADYCGTCWSPLRANPNAALRDCPMGCHEDGAA